MTGAFDPCPRILRQGWPWYRLAPSLPIAEASERTNQLGKLI
jgi:hypothetical protein